MSWFELLMLMCFGAAWPLSIMKSWKSRCVEGKSVGFLYVVLIGYVSGGAHKIFYDFDAIFWMYVLNGTMVAIDICLYYRNLWLCSGGGARGQETERAQSQRITS